MGTHNLLAQTGDTKYFEVIAIDPDAPPPAHPRWFSLDSDFTKNRLMIRPRSLTWVVTTNDIAAVVAESPLNLGKIITMSRGNLSWQLYVLKDGSLVEGGLVPTFIQWNTTPHPSINMANIGLHLDNIKLTHKNPAWLIKILQQLKVAHLATIVAGDQSIKFCMSHNNQSFTID